MTAFNVFNFVVILFNCLAYGKEIYVGLIACDWAPHHLHCPTPNFCTATCTDACNKEGEYPRIWGAKVYTYDSPICRSAVHDYRMSPWTLPANVTYQRSPVDTKKYLGSIEDGIISTDYGALAYSYPPNGHFIFTSPYITEELLDVSTLNFGNLYKRDDFIQQCHISGKAESYYLDFNYFIPSSEKKKGVPHSLKDGVMYWHQISWTNQSLKPGGYWCNIHGNRLSDVMSLSMAADAHFVPDHWTITASTQEDISITFTESQQVTPNFGYTWRKDGKDNFRYFDNMREKKSGKQYSINIQDVDVGDAGIYSIEFKQKSFKEKGTRYLKRGIARLIVRRCNNDYFGPFCSEVCPTCLNGGICHDITGTCVCPPGFNGTYCENACQEDYFGRNCTKHCESVQQFGNSCRGILFCLPDPYGCSCAAGYKGIDCEQSCSPGEYGAGCLQKRICHCSGNRSCNPKSGLCHYGCSNGWKGKSCTISYPYLLYPPNLVLANADSLEIEFTTWDSNQTGQGQPAFYIVELREEDLPSATWRIDQMIKADEGNDTETKFVTLANLKSATRYGVRVVIQDVDEQIQREMAPVETFKTICGKPSLPPQDIHINTTLSRKVTVTWMIPPATSWNCEAVTVTIMYANSEKEFLKKGLGGDRFEFESKPFTKWTISARLDTDYEEHSDWTDSVSGITEEDAPEEVQNFRVVNESNRFHLSWEKPLVENGNIREYLVQLQHVQWRHKCNYNVHGLNFTVPGNIFELKIQNVAEYFSIYKISIAAVTIKLGKSVEQQVLTPESVPVGKPQNIKVIYSQSATQLMLNWEMPPCQLAKGYVNSYLLTYEGQEQWDSQERNRTVNFYSALLDDLVPYTTYRIRIYACTDMGCSQAYAETEATTKSQEPLPPTNLTIYSTTESTLSVTWKPPYPPYGKLLNYYIYYKEMNEHIDHHFKLDALQYFCNETIRNGWICFMLNDLSPRKCYAVYVTVENDGGKKNSSTVHGETEESVPDPPTSLNLNSSTENSLEVTWQEPYRSNGNLTGYRLNATLISSFGSKESVNKQILSKELNNLTWNITGLQPATEYNISVTARTKKGHGLPLWKIFTTRNSEPKIQEEPIVGLVTKHTVDILMRPLNFTAGPISAYYILVREIGTQQRRKRSPVADLSLLVDYNTSQTERLTHYATARFFPTQVPKQGVNVTIGDGRSYGGYFNAPLATGRKYNFGMAVLSNFSGDVRIGLRYISKNVIVEDLLANSGMVTTGAIVGSLLVLLLLCIVAILFIMYRKPKWFKAVKRTSLTKFQILNRKQEENCIAESTLSLETAITEEVSNHITSHCIPIDKLENYIQTMTQNDVLEEEYKSISKKQIHLTAAAKLPENKSKNRYGNLLPYDHSRVRLEKTPNDNFSDYINASYISGYKEEQKYIATQGPKQQTVADFWKMIWQEKVDKIIMTTNLTENGKVKCEQYWPDIPPTNKYGAITATLLDTEVYADYIIRTFQIFKENEQRQIRQFHFTSWPDHGVPLYPVAIGGFLKQVDSYNSNTQGPVTVHCSAGVGRTGTIILIDSMVAMGKEEGKVDVLGHLNKIRQQRMNLVETYGQYEFVFRALADILCGEETSIPSSKYYEELEKLRRQDKKSGKSQIQVQFQRLQKLCPPLLFENCSSGHEKFHKEKNRSSSIIPPDSSRFLLPASDLFVSNYINAVYVNGYKQKDAFIVTQLPTKNTCADFWRMIGSCRTSTIVLMHRMQNNDEEAYWPEEGTSVEYGPLIVELSASETQGDVVLRTFNIKDKSKKTDKNLQVVRQFHLQNWHCNNSLPSAEIIIDLIEKVERWQKQSKTPHIIVQCLNGACASGIFCASVFICDKIKIEQEVDVFLAVRSIRSNRPQFIDTMEQYDFLHQVASTFLDSFETYANFQ